MKIFQSTLLQEERRIFSCHLKPVHQISIHAPTRGATKMVFIYLHSVVKFQSTLLQEERRLMVCFMGIALLFQSTLLQEERHNIYILLALTTYFNPRSYKRSDRPASFYIQCRKNFNPRSYKRSDEYHRTDGHNTGISIHAPTRGATAKMHNIPYASLQ